MTRPAKHPPHGAAKSEKAPLDSSLKPRSRFGAVQGCWTGSPAVRDACQFFCGFTNQRHAASDSWNLDLGAQSQLTSGQAVLRTR